MLRKLVTTIAAGGALAAGLAFAAPASAAQAAPPDNCNITSSFCNIIDDANGPRFIFGTNHNEAMIGSTSADQYNAQSVGGGWYIVVNTQNGLVWNEANGKVYNDSYSVGDEAELFTFVNSPYHSGAHLILNEALGNHWALQCCVNTFLAWGNGFSNGTEDWNWKG